MSTDTTPRPAEAVARTHEQTLVIERTDRVLLRAHGRDPVKMMQGLITNDLAGAPPDRAVFAGVLTPKGRLIAELRTWHDDGTVMIETARAALPGLLAHFRKFVPPLFARFDVLEAARVLGVYGADAGARVQQALQANATEGEDAIAHTDSLTLIGTRYAGENGIDIISSDSASAVADSLLQRGALSGSLEELEVLRIEAGQPRWGAELDEETIPLEAGLRPRMISETKGCYTGQEVIIRILHRGHVNRHLRGLLLGSIDPPPARAPLFDPQQQKQVGLITSATVSSRFGQTIALGYVRREVIPPGELRLGDAAGPVVHVLELPFPRSAEART